jgi:aminotransferase
MADLSAKLRGMKVSAIKQVELMAAKQGGVVSLAQGIPAFDTPEPLKQAAIEAVASGNAAAYSLTYGMPELRKAIQADRSTGIKSNCQASRFA